MYRVAVLACVLSAFLTGASAVLAAGDATDLAPDADESDGIEAIPEGFSLSLVGLRISGIEVGDLIVFEDDGRFWLALEDLEHFLSIKVERDAGALSAATPIGTVPLVPAEVRLLEGREYLAPTALQEKLKTRIQFDAAEFALILTPPWLGVTPDADAETTALEPEVRAPDHSLSRANAELTYEADGTHASLTGRYLFEGRAAGGRWRLRYTDDFADHRTLNEYAWVRPLDKGFLLLGRQRVSLHPLLGSYELTGAQYGLANRALTGLVQDPTAGVVIPRGLQPTRTFAGEGPPGGIAELYINDRFVASETIQLDGRYEFIDVPLVSQLNTRIEVRVYERFNRATPVEIREQRIGPSQFLLKKDMAVHLGGAGLAGNWLDGMLFENGSSSSGQSPAGFYQWRYGLTPRLTLESVLQQTDHRTQFLAGIVARVGENATTSLAAASSGGRLGYEFGIDATGERWRLSLASGFRQNGFLPTDAIDTYDHALDLSYKVDETLDLSLIGRHWRSSADRASFLLPAVAWRPNGRMRLLARPGYDGEYRVDSSYQATRNTRLSARYDRGPAAELEHRFDHRLRGRLTGYRRAGREAAYAATLSWRGAGDMRPVLRGGVLTEGGELGFIAGASIEPLPGVYLAVDASSVPLVDEFGQEDDMTLRATLSVDFGLARGRLVPTTMTAFTGASGAIGGQVRLPPGSAIAGLDLADVQIAVSGGPSGYTGSGGTFFIGNLKPGVYRVMLQPEALPIELVPVKPAILVEVAAGSVTRVDFEVRPEYGIAGRVRDGAGQNLIGRRVDLRDGAGETVASGFTDAFGLYRLDGIPPGQYRLRAAGPADEDAGGASRQIRVTDDFLFDQDLTVDR